MRQLCFLLLPTLSLLSFSIFAADATAKPKETAIALKGEAIPAGGYKIYFSEDKSSYFGVKGYARFLSTWNVDNKANAADSKFAIPYFRLFFDGQSDKTWSWHTRLDYNHNFFRHKNSGTAPANGVPGVYFARAYITYTHNDNLKVDFGRVANLIHRFDVLNNADVKVSYGALANYQYNDFNLKLTANYDTPNQKMPGATNSPAIAQDANQVTTLGARAGYEFKFSKDYGFGVGFTAQAETNTPKEKVVQFLPDLMFTGPNEFYVLNQSLKKQFTGSTATIYESYNEVGFGIKSKWYPDLNYRLTREIPGAKTQHDVGVELITKHTPAVSTLIAFYYENITADLKENKNKKVQAYIHYDF